MGFVVGWVVCVAVDSLQGGFCLGELVFLDKPPRGLGDKEDPSTKGKRWEALQCKRGTPLRPGHIHKVEAVPNPRGQRVSSQDGDSV